jgi:hypothetical protein
MHLYRLNKHHARPLGVTIAVFLLALALLFFLSGVVEDKSIESGRTRLETALHRAIVTCFAVEGRYPPSLQYITENYGVSYDDDRYVVFYDAFAANVLPTVSVSVRGQE